MVLRSPQFWLLASLISIAMVALAAGCADAATLREASVLRLPTPVQTVTPIPPPNAAASPAANPTVFLVVTYFLPTPTPTATATQTPTATTTPTTTPPSRTLAPAPEGIWISAEELAALPMEGPAWYRLKAAADGWLGEPNMSGWTANHDVLTLAVALVYARTADEHYQHKAAQAIRDTIGTEHTGLRKRSRPERGGLAVIVGRNLVSYIIAADLIDLAGYDPRLNAQFRAWIQGLLHARWVDGSLVLEDERPATTHGRMAGASRAAIAVYLGDEEELTRTAQVFKGFLGDRESYSDFIFQADRSWQANLYQPVGINPAGAILGGYPIDGALTEEMRRGCTFRFPPCHTGYPWEALQGTVVEANILHRQGFDVWNWEDKAILRAVQFLYDLQQTYPETPWWAVEDDTWVPWLINGVYGTNFPTDPANIGKNMGWTDWTHGPVG